MSYVIVNESDQPCARLIAQVTDENECQYLSAKLHHDLTLGLKRATPLENFGVTVSRGLYSYTVIPISESTATYSDGTPRKWQESGNPEQPLKKKFWGD